MSRFVPLLFLLAALVLANPAGSFAAETPDRIDKLIRALDDPSPWARQDAARDLGREENLPARALPALLKAVRDRKYDVSSAAAEAVAKMGRPGILALIGILKQNNPSVLQAVTLALGNAGKVTYPALVAVLADTKAPELQRYAAADALEIALSSIRDNWRGLRPTVESQAVPVLIAALDDKSARLREMAAAALGTLGTTDDRAGAALVKALSDGNRSLTLAAAEALQKIGVPRRGAVRPMIALLSDKDKSTRELAFDALEKMAAVAQEAIAPLGEIMRSGKYQGMGSNAARVLGKIGPAALGEILPSVYEKDRDIRWSAAAALRGMGARGVPALVTRLGDPSATKRRQAVRALGWIRQSAAEAVPALGRTLGDEDHLVRRTAAVALGEFGPRARPATEALARALGDTDRRTGHQAARALGIIGPGAGKAVPALMAYARQNKGAPRLTAVKSLGRIGRTKAAVPMLARFLTDSSVALREAAARALGETGPYAKAGVADLARALDDGKSRVRRAAAQALGRIGPESVPAIPALATAMKDPAASVRREAAEALGEIDFQSDAASAALALGVDDPEFGVRLAAVNSLVRFGPEAADAVPALLRAMQSADPGYRNQRAVQKLAIRALGEIGPAAESAVPALTKAVPEYEGDKHKGKVACVIGPCLFCKNIRSEQRPTRALARIGGPGIAALKTLSRPPYDQCVRRAASAALSRR